MGKKTKKAKAIKEDRERLNETVTMATFGIGPGTTSHLSRQERRAMERDMARSAGGSQTIPSGECMHGDPVRTSWPENVRLNWVNRASCVAHYGQRYQYQSTMAIPNQVPCCYVIMHSRLIDNLFVKVAYASAADEFLDGHDLELSRIKLELAICAEAFVDNGRPNLTFFLENLHDTTVCPPWFREMVETLERVRSSQHHATICLASKLPCHCLDQAVEEAQAALAASPNAASSGETITRCDHGKPSDQTEAWYQEMESKIRHFSLDESNCSPRDFDMLHELLVSNPECANENFVRFCYSVAARIIVDERRFEWAENACNFALMANAHVQHGAAKVGADIQAMKDSKDAMEPYLRDLYMNLRKTANPTAGLLQFLSHQIPCDCLAESRAHFRAEGDATRPVFCVICEGVAKKSEFKFCSKCHIERYCSRTCQLNDWQTHKSMCRRLCGAANRQEVG